MEKEDKKRAGKIIKGSIFAIIGCVLCSCSALTYSGYDDHDWPWPITLYETYTKVGADTIVPLPQLIVKDTVLHKTFDDIMYLDSIYLSYSKFGEKSWYEVNMNEHSDTIFIEVRAHQYDAYWRPSKGKFDGMVVYRENYFLIRGDSASCNMTTSQSGDTLEFIFHGIGVKIYYILDRDYNFPEYAVIKYHYHKGCLQKHYVEINHAVLENGYFRKKS